MIFLMSGLNGLSDASCPTVHFHTPLHHLSNTICKSYEKQSEERDRIIINLNVDIMKARLAKKIINASEVYYFYCRECNPHSRFKYHPYWTNQWIYRTTLKRYPTTIVKSFDQRLNFALYRLPHYAKEIMKCEVKNKPTKRLRRCKAQH